MKSFDLFLHSSGVISAGFRRLLLAVAGIVGSINFMLIAFPPWASGHEGLALRCALFGNVLCAMIIGGILVSQRVRQEGLPRKSVHRAKSGARDYGRDWAVHLQD